MNEYKEREREKNERHIKVEYTCVDLRNDWKA